MVIFELKHFLVALFRSVSPTSNLKKLSLSHKCEYYFRHAKTSSKNLILTTTKIIEKNFFEKKYFDTLPLWFKKTMGVEYGSVILDRGKAEKATNLFFGFGQIKRKIGGQFL